MAENPFRILLDFRELNFKFYKFVWMSILPRELVTIKDLKDAILKKFSFERTDLQLFLRDGLLPEDENISNILRENDSVRLFYAELSNLNDSRTTNYEGNDPSTSDEQGESSKKRKIHSDVSINLEENDEQVKSNKKRKHSFSNGTYLFENNSTPENSALINAAPDNGENIIHANLYSLENKQRKSCEIKKKLKFSNDVSKNSVVCDNETFLSSDGIPMSEKNESRVNSCKKKKKHKHSKDVSESEIIFHDMVTMSEINENEPKFHKKKKKHKHSLGASKNGVSFCDAVIDIAEKLDDVVNDLESNIELSGLKETIFETVTDDSEILKVAPVSFCTSSVNTSSGIGSLKGSEENNQNMSPEKNCSVSYISDSNPISELPENNLSGQGNSCKKRKRKRQRKRKSLLINPQIDVSNECNLDMSPQKKESLNSSLTSTYQTAEISPINKEISDSSKSNAYLSSRNINCPETRSIFLEPFSYFHPSTSTPFSQTNVVSSASPRDNVISKFPSSSNVSQNESYSVTVPQNTIQKKMDGNSLCSSLLPCSVTEKNVKVSSYNFHEKSLSTKINYSPGESTDSVSKIGIKSRSMDPNSYEGCPPLNSCPLVGTHIAYKVLELDATYCPVESKYKEGLVRTVNSQTDELEIELIEPEIKKGRTGKFENIYEEDLPTYEVIRKETLTWPSLINPVRVLY